MQPVIRKQTGLSLAEALLSVVIVATIIAMTIRFITQNTFTAQIAQASNTIQTLTNASYIWLQAQKQLDFNGGVACTTSGGANEVSLQQLYNANLIQFNCPAGGICKANPWGGTISVSHYNNPNNNLPACDSQYVMITFTQVPITACHNLINRMSIANYKDQTQPAQCMANGNYFIAL